MLQHTLLHCWSYFKEGRQLTVSGQPVFTYRYYDKPTNLLKDFSDQLVQEGYVPQSISVVSVHTDDIERLSARFDSFAADDEWFFSSCYEKVLGECRTIDRTRLYADQVSFIDQNIHQRSLDIIEGIELIDRSIPEFRSRLKEATSIISTITLEEEYNSDVYDKAIFTRKSISDQLSTLEEQREVFVTYLGEVAEIKASIFS